MGPAAKIRSRTAQQMTEPVRRATQIPPYPVQRAGRLPPRRRITAARRICRPEKMRPVRRSRTAKFPPRTKAGRECPKTAGECCQTGVRQVPPWSPCPARNKSRLPRKALRCPGRKMIPAQQNPPLGTAGTQGAKAGNPAGRCRVVRICRREVQDRLLFQPKAGFCWAGACR